MMLRAADMSDWARLFHWRNHPSTVAMSGSAPVSLATHLAWFTETLSQGAKSQLPTRRIWVAHDPQRSCYVGMIRLDTDEPKTGRISIIIDPAQRGLSYGETLLHDGLAAIADTTKVSTVTAAVRETNTASLRLFAGAGFRPSPIPTEPDTFVFLTKRITR